MITDFEIYKAVQRSVHPLVYDENLNKVRQELPSISMFEAVLVAAERSAGKTICKGCGVICEQGGRYYGCCSFTCHRDANC